MAVDQSHRYYYRLQDPTDEVYSPGWEGVAHGVGVNGGVLLLHAARARHARFAASLAALTHEGAAARLAGRLERFCELAEQDALNLAILRAPEIWRPLDCVWNYMATSVGGHRLAADPLSLPLTYYDECPLGPLGANGKPGADLLRIRSCRPAHRSPLSPRSGKRVAAASCAASPALPPAPAPWRTGGP